MNKTKLLTIIFILICIIGITANIILVSKNVFFKKFSFNTELTFEDGNTYGIKIKKIKSTDNKLNKKINSIVNSSRDTFVKEINKNEGQLNIDYEYSKYGNVYSFHLISTSNIKDTIKRKDYIIYYDEKIKKVIQQNDLIKKDFGLYTIFNSKSVDYLKEKEVKDYNESLLEIDDKNYQLLVFSKNDLHILIIDNDKEISIPIKYGYIKDYLNKDYFKDIKAIKDEIKEDKIEVTEEKVETAQEDVDKTQDLNLPKYLAFTFDDGPAPETTIPLLDGLKQRGVHATFFVLGNRAQNQIDIINRMKNEGHVVGSHTYSHKNLLKLSLPEALEDINKTNDILTNILGEKPKFLRPPYGNYNKSILENSNMTFILWSVDTEDWKKRDTELVYEYIINNVNDGDIVLLHDLYSTSVEGVLKAIDYLSNENYRFVNIEELFSKKSINIEVNKSYRFIR